MKTIRRFTNIAEAGFACSLLEAAGINAALADEHAYTLGPQYAPWGIRLQVSEPDADRAERVLDQQEGFSPLPDDFVPPPEPADSLAAPSDRKSNMTGAFLRGGIWALVAFGALAGVTLAAGGEAHADVGGVLLYFGLGGIAGLVVRAIKNKGRRDECANDPND